ncbi:MAG: hypothetical protein HOH74_09755 [Gemmatimonadetes bacterium]|nr:hypothetical protein [Gemmatimonadota bacterium]
MPVTVMDSEILADTQQHAARLQQDVGRWLTQSSLKDGPQRNQGGEDEANYALTWFPHFLITGDGAVLARCRSLLADLAGWVAADCLHGYEPEAEAHHGTEPFLLFLPRYLGLVPDDHVARSLLEDAAHHVGNWVPEIPPWYDYERDVFRGYSIGSRVVDDAPQYQVELTEHLRFVHIALAAHRVLGDDRYLQWALRYGGKRAERLVKASDPLPLGWDLDGTELHWQDAGTRPQFGGMCALGHKISGDPLGGVENHLASGAVMAYADLYAASGDVLFQQAARRIVEPLIGQLADPFGDPAAAAVSHYRIAFGDTSYDAAALQAINSAPPQNDAPWVLMEPEERKRREPGIGKRSDMLYWGEFSEDGSARPLREPSTAASTLAFQISGDVAYARRALQGAARKFGIALRILRGGREHADMGGAICSVAAGHGRNWGTGAVTGCYGSLLLGCQEIRGAVEPAVHLRDADGIARVPHGMLSLVRPAVGPEAGELLLFNGGDTDVTLTWCAAAGRQASETVSAGATLRRPLEG